MSVGARLGGRAAVARRLASAAPLSERDGHALAGLLDAEGSFAITPNNNGRNWRCSLSVCLRRDDAPILFRFHEFTGLGTIVATPARGTSKPQATWNIRSNLECLRLAELIERFPLRGRKRLDAGVWVAAVRALEQRRFTELPDLATRIREVRRYVDPGDAPPYPPHDEPGLLWYFGGFFTGEGWLQLSQRTSRAGIRLRRDDRPLLQAFAAISGLGKIYEDERGGIGNPISTWVILNQGELPAAIEMFSAARLLGRKRREFHVWQIGAEEFVRARRDRNSRSRELLESVASRLRTTRAYRNFRMPPVHDDASAKREAFIESMGTLHLAFGSWWSALAAAGLASRAHARSANLGAGAL